MSRNFKFLLLAVFTFMATIAILFLGHKALAQSEHLRFIYMAGTAGLMATLGISLINWSNLKDSWNTLRLPPLDYEGYYTTVLHQKNRAIEDLLETILTLTPPAQMYDGVLVKRLANLYFTHYLGLYEFMSDEYDWKPWAAGAIRHGPLVGDFLREMAQFILDQNGRVLSCGKDGEYYEHEVPLRIPDHLRLQLEQYVDPNGPVVMTRNEARRHLERTFGA